MRLISSRQTFLYKRVFPIIWVVSMVAFLGGGIASGAGVYLGVPVVLLVLGYLVHRFVISDLADRVFDSGDGLVVKRGDVEERIAFSDIENVRWWVYMTLARVTVSLRDSGRIGRRFAFLAPAFSTSGEIRLLIDLARRIDNARTTG